MSRIPCSIVDSIALIAKGKSLFVPRSLFCDLADLSMAELRAKGSDWTLTLHGGDASESYVLTIEFDEHYIRRRVLLDSESGEKLQETIYYRLG